MIRLVALALCLGACSPITSTWRAADVDGAIVCRLEKAPGTDVPVLTCRTVDVPSDE